MESVVEDIKYNTEIAKVTLKSVPDRPGIAGLLFSTLGEHGFNVELIAQSSAGRKRTDISFIIGQNDLESVLKLLSAIKMRFTTRQIMVDKDVAMITIYGRKLPETPGIAGKLLSILANQKINNDIISA
ncbi:MAG: ACT domain-containing protein, partial [candidate division WOR-3 bacterium]